MLPTFFFFTFLSIMFLVLLVLEKKRRAWFKEQFPPISEDEFVARCTPGTSREVALKVRRIFSEALCVEYDRIYPSSRLVEDLGAD